MAAEPEMQILVMGLFRTGTYSIKIALEQLGYKEVYHMQTIRKDPTHLPLWNRALEAKYEGKGKPLTNEEWKYLLKGYQAGTDVPFCFFTEELLEVFPNAVVILTTREVDGWYKSVLSTIYDVLDRHHFLGQIKRAFTTRQPESRMFDIIFEDVFYNNFARYGKRVFHDHNEHVKLVTPPERYLEFRSKDGWEPLCKFLGKEIPVTEYPRSNSTAFFRKMTKIDKTQRRRNLVAAAVITGVAGVAWITRKLWC